MNSIAFNISLKVASKQDRFASFKHGSNIYSGVGFYVMRGVKNDGIKKTFFLTYYLPAKSTKLITAPLAISFPALFLLFWMNEIPTIVWALDEVAFMLVLKQKILADF